MEYTADSVQELVNKSVALSTRQWVPGKESNPAAIQRVREEFASRRIRPETGRVEVESATAAVLKIETGMRCVWWITDSAEQRVFFDEGTTSFGVGWGPDAATDVYIDLGFRTPDPIDAFLA